MAAAPKTIAIIGAGGRGQGHARRVAEHEYLGKVVAVADPRDAYRQKIVGSCGGQQSSRQTGAQSPKVCAQDDRDYVQDHDRQFAGIFIDGQSEQKRACSQLQRKQVTNQDFPDGLPC